MKVSGKARPVTPPRSHIRFQKAKRVLRDIIVGPLSIKQMAVLCRELKATDSAGLPLIQSLRIIGEHTHAIRLRRLLLHMAEQIRDGASFSDAVQWHKGRFPSLFVEMVASGEASGKLALSFEYLAEYFEEHLRIRRGTINALAYPALVFVAAGFFIPLLTSLLSQLAGVPHAPARDILFNGAICLALLAFKVWLLIRLRIPQTLWRLFGGFLPVFGPIARQMALSRFFQCLAMLLEAGLGTPRAIEHAARVAGNIPLGLSVAKAAERMRRGDTLSEALSDSVYVDSVMQAMLSVGETSGKVDQSLRKLSQYAQNTAMHRVRILILTAESLLIIVFGLLVIF